MKKDLIDNLIKLVQAIIRNAWVGAGIDPKSDLIKSIKLQYSNADGIIIYSNSYAENIQKGRKKFSKKIPISFFMAAVLRTICMSKGDDINHPGEYINVVLFLV